MNRMLGIAFAGDPELREKLEDELEHRECRQNEQNKKDFYCCKKSKKSQINLSAQFGRLKNYFDHFLSFFHHLPKYPF